jgi:septal ring factor EnvC (AmiA/AmiB activator)
MLAYRKRPPYYTTELLIEDVDEYLESWGWTVSTSSSTAPKVKSAMVEARDRREAIAAALKWKLEAPQRAAKAALERKERKREDEARWARAERREQEANAAAKTAWLAREEKRKIAHEKRQAQYNRMVKSRKWKTAGRQVTTWYNFAKPEGKCFWPVPLDDMWIKK